MADILDEMEALMPKLEQPTTGDARPVYANGASPQTPINSSPLSAVDRVKMSFGNPEGQTKFLQEKFKQVSQDTDGNVVVQDQDNLWKKIDAKGFGSVSPWEATASLFSGDPSKLMEIGAEALGDAADVAPIITAVGASGLAAFLTGGTSLIGQAALQFGTGVGMATAGTVLGSLSGTKEGSPEEFIPEIAMEGFLNLGGVLIPPAVVKGAKVGMGVAEKLTQSRIAQGIIQAGKNLSVLPETVKSVLAQSYGAFTGVGENNIYRAMTNADDIAREMSKAGVASATGDAGAQTFLREGQVNAVASLADHSRQALSKMYGEGLEEISKQVPKTASIDFNLASGTIKKALEATGVVETQAGRLVAKSPKAVTAAINSGQTSELATLAAVPGNKVQGIINRVLGVVEAQNSRAMQLGKSDPLKAFQIARKSVDDEFSSILKGLYKEGQSNLAKEIDTIAATFVSKLDEVAGEGFKAAGATEDIIGKFAQLNSRYGQIKQEIQPLLNVQQQLLNGNKGPAESFLKNMIATAKSGSVAKTAGKSAVEELSSHSKEISKLYNDVLNKEAALNFMPKIRGSFIQFAPVLAGGAGLASGDLETAGVAGFATAAVTSPRMAFNVVKQLAGREQQILAKGLLKARQATLTMSEGSRKAMLSNPKALSSFLAMPINGVIQYKQAQSQLVGQGQ